MSDPSFVHWYADTERHLCGYCKSKKGSVSHGMWAKTLTVDDYQNLIDRGWRRSGHYCYKPLMNETCCPAYTIKCDALNFQLSKSQKKVIKKLNKFLKDGELKKNSGEQNGENSDAVSDFVYREAPEHVLDQEVVENLVESDEIDGVAPDKNPVGATIAEQSQIDSAAVPSQSQTKPNERLKNLSKGGSGADPSKPPCKKAKILRLERRREKLLKRGMSLEKIGVKNEQKSLEDFLGEAPQDGRHKLKITLDKIHESHKHFELTAKLFAKYQIFVHNDKPGECDEFQYLHFLVESPLQHVRFGDSDLGLGSFHQLYWLDDKLIAVGVVDILPKCVSAVYFFYDPDYRDLTLGTYGSLRELEFARLLHEKLPSIENYYMGFYIHSCPKMRYKGKLTPSYLLCPETYHWVPIERCIPKLEISKYSKLEENEAAVDEDLCSPRDLDRIKILANRKLVLFKQYKRKYDVEEDFETIGRLIGKKCAKSLTFCF